MAARVRIDSHEEVILSLANFYGCIEVSTLKVAIEDGLMLLLESGVHASKETGVFGFEMIIEFAKVCGEVREVGIYE